MTGEVARLLGVSERTVQRLSDRGFLPALRLVPYSPRRYRREDVEALLERAQGRTP